jgi:hypothetical protein
MLSKQTTRCGRAEGRPRGNPVADRRQETRENVFPNPCAGPVPSPIVLLNHLTKDRPGILRATERT